MIVECIARGGLCLPYNWFMTADDPTFISSMVRFKHSTGNDEFNSNSMTPFCMFAIDLFDIVAICFHFVLLLS